jgi:hypothetical protein
MLSIVLILLCIFVYRWIVGKCKYDQLMSSQPRDPGAGWRENEERGY